MGVLSADETKRLLKAMGAAGINVLASPRVLTLSRSQCEMKVVDIRSVVTGMDRSVPASPRPISEKIELGPILSVVPTVGMDDETIRINGAGQHSTFLGYESASGGRCGFPNYNSSVAGSRCSQLAG